MALISDLVPDVLINAPGAPDILVEQKLRDAAIELCNMSGYWRESLDPIITVDGQDIYDIEAPAQALIKNIVTMQIDGGTVHPSTTADLDRRSHGWRTNKGKPRRYVMNSMRTFMLTPIPNAEYTVTAFATLRPDATANELADILVDFQRQVIVDGALFKLLSMPKRQWTDLQMAAVHRRDFYRGVTQARIDANRQYTSAPMFLQPKPFA